MAKQSLLLGETDEEPACVEFLRDRGYIVVPPTTTMKDVLTREDYNEITSIQKLIIFFYERMFFYNKDRNIHYSSASTVDKKHAKSLVESRIKLGAGKKRAFAESAYIIDILLKNEPFLNLDKPISSMVVLGQDKYKWLTDAVLSIINNERTMLAEFEENLKMEKLLLKWENEYKEGFNGPK